MSMISRFTDKVIGDKRRWRAYQERTKQLPENYRTAVEGLERYLMYTGPGDGDRLMTMIEDLADLFEQSAAAGTPVREIVGDDPVEFAEAFKRNYGLSQWLNKEQQRLTSAIERATSRESGSR